MRQPSFTAKTARVAQRDAGFTLIELIIALGLMGLILSLLFGGLRFSSTVWNAVQTRSTTAQASEATRRVVRRLLEGAQPVRGRRGTLRFNGTATRLHFVGPPPANTKRGDRFDLILEQKADTLTLRWRPFVPSTAETEGATWKSRALATDVKNVSFRYFAAAERNGKPRWHTAWRDRKFQPMLVEVAIKRATETETLLTRIRIDPSSGR